jgi:hypothetical protein
MEKGGRKGRQRTGPKRKREGSKEVLIFFRANYCMTLWRQQHA